MASANNTTINGRFGSGNKPKYNRFIDKNILSFGEYKGWHIQDVLRIRGMRIWIRSKEFIKKDYEYIYNCAMEYNPREKFIDWDAIPDQEKSKDNLLFYDTYIFFHLLPYSRLKNIQLRDNLEIMCYNYYFNLVSDLKSKVEFRMENELENMYDIKAPKNWLNDLDKGTDETTGDINRDMFKEFIEAYDLPNITEVVRDIKAAGGIEYKGHDARIISKRNSEKQEAHWEEILKGMSGDNIGIQFKHEKCIFDFINFEKKIVYECKLSLKDFDKKQYDKYLVTVDCYKIVYLISTDCVIDTQEMIVYTLNIPKYESYITNISYNNNPTYLDKILLTCSVKELDWANDSIF